MWCKTLIFIIKIEKKEILKERNLELPREVKLIGNNKKHHDPGQERSNQASN